MKISMNKQTIIVRFDGFHVHLENADADIPEMNCSLCLEYSLNRFAVSLPLQPISGVVLKLVLLRMGRAGLD